MQRLFIPFLFDDDSHVRKNDGSVAMVVEQMLGYPTIEKAEEEGRRMAMNNPRGKVVIFQSSMLLEPRKIEFAAKKYNDAGELIT